MGKILRNGIEFSSTSDTANNINYDNSKSGLDAVTVQEAVDEVTERLNVYSTTPKKIGKYINGEDLYEVTVRINVANSEWHDINHGISGITKVVAIFPPINDNGVLMNVGIANYSEWVGCLNTINQTTIRAFAGLHHQGMWSVTFRYI